MREATATIQLTASTTINNLLTGAGTSAQATVGGAIISESLKSGVSANEINRIYWADNIALTETEVDDGTPGLIDPSVYGQTTTLDITRFDTLDIGAGLGKDPVGAAFDLEEIVLLLIRNHPDSAGRLIVQTQFPTAGVPWIRPAWHLAVDPSGSPFASIEPGGFHLYYEPGESGLDVAFGSLSNLRLAGYTGTLSPGAANAARAQVLILGRSKDSVDLQWTLQGTVTPVNTKVIVDEDGFVNLQNTSGTTEGVTSVALTSAGQFLVPVPPGDLTADPSPFDAITSNTTSAITFTNTTDFTVGAGTSIRLPAKYIIP